MSEASESQKPRLAILSPAAAVVVTLSGIVLHFFITLVLGYQLISAAYLYADSIPHGGSVDSYDQLYKLGSSPWFGYLALALSGSIGFITSLALLGIERTRPYAWLVPLIGIGVSILAAVLAVAGFQPPAPDIGG